MKGGKAHFHFTYIRRLSAFPPFRRFATLCGLTSKVLIDQSAESINLKGMSFTFLFRLCKLALE